MLGMNDSPHCSSLALGEYPRIWFIFCVPPSKIEGSKEPALGNGDTSIIGKIYHVNLIDASQILPLLLGDCQKTREKILLVVTSCLVFN